MAYYIERAYFTIDNAPSMSHLLAEEIKSYDHPEDQLIVCFTVVPTTTGIRLLGHHQIFKIPFEVALKGTTSATGHGVNGLKNIRLLGRFLTPEELQPNFINPEVASELNVWQWEVIFNPLYPKGGYVIKLFDPLPKEWTE